MKEYYKLLCFLLITVVMQYSPITAVCQNDLNISQTDSRTKDYMIIEGDIMVPKDFFESDACYTSNFWTDGIIPYQFNENVNQSNKDSALVAMEKWEEVANVDFIPRNGHWHYIEFKDSTLNSSMVGMHYFGQVVNIVSWGNTFIIAHELCHALGFWHEQSRLDRDIFVQINWDCIADGEEHNFNLHSEAGVYGYYDFMSLMHYGGGAFYDPTDPNCTDPNSITVLFPNQAYQSLIGQRDSLTYLDRITMSFIYPEANWVFLDINNEGNQSGTFFQPFQLFSMGMFYTPPGGTLWIQPGTYLGVGTYDKEMTIKAPLGDVIIQ